MSAISGFCEKCNDFKKRYCGGDRNTCMTILFDRIEVLQHENNVIKNCLNTAEKAIEALQQENEQLRAQLDEWKYEVKCHMDEVIAREKQMERMRKSNEN